MAKEATGDGVGSSSLAGAAGRPRRRRDRDLCASAETAPLGRAGDEPGPAGAGTLVAGRYRLAERLSEQHGSSIWKAADEILGRPVIVYPITAGFCQVGPVMAAARAAGQLNDPRLLQIFDADDRSAHPYIVAEWPPGIRLDDLLADGPLGAGRAAEIIAAAAGALAVAHAAGLAHLCLTPDSLWWDARGGVKISGLAVAAALAGVQAASPAAADARGLARLLYAALTGCWPGAGQTTLPAAPCCAGRALSPRQVRDWVPRDIDAVTCRALFGEEGSDGPPILNPAQLAAALAALARPVSQPPARAIRPGPARVPLPVPLRRQPPGPAAMAATAASATATDAVAVTPVQPMPAVPPAAAARPRPRTVAMTSARQPAIPGRQARLPAGVARALLGAAVMLVLAVIAVGGWLLVRGMTSGHGAGAGPGRPAAARTIRPASAAAFGPNGDGQGDNGQLARLAIDASPATGWHTDWYTTAGFGNLQQGTGLLVDMGRTMTLTRAQITLGSIRGADFQLRVGAGASGLADLRPVAGATDAGGRVDLRLVRPAHGRYVLVWFTRLPPDASGTFQAGVYNVRLEGSAS